MCVCVFMVCVADSSSLSGFLCFSHGVVPVDESEEEFFFAAADLSSHMSAWNKWIKE